MTGSILLGLIGLGMVIWAVAFTIRLLFWVFEPFTDCNCKRHYY